MDLSVKIMSKIDTLSSILNFQTDDTSVYWRGALFKAYPFLDEKKCLNMAWNERKEYLTAELSKIYDKIEIDLQKNVLFSKKVGKKTKKN